MSFKSFLARKFLTGKSRTALFSTLALIALFGVVVSVAAFVVVEGVVVGFNADLQDKILGFSAHLSIKDKNLIPSLEQMPQVSSIQAHTEGEAVLRTIDGSVLGVRLRGFKQGVAPPEGMNINLEEGEAWENLWGEGEAMPGILLGTELAQELGIIAALSEEIELIFPLGDVGPTGEIEPNIRKFRVLGTFRSGYYDYDHKFAILAEREAQILLGDQARSFHAVFLKDPMKAAQIKENLAPGSDQVITWQEVHRRLFQALKLERLGMALVLGLMLILSSFNILSLLMLLVYQRRQDLVVLRCLGMSSREMGAMLRWAGLWIGGLGGGLGVTLGLTILWALGHFKIPLPGTYYLEALPVQIHWGIPLVALFVAILLSVLASLLPSRVSQKLNLVEGLRYE